ncbi:MAG: glycosyltransferase, partial [Lachnospiraceae bacterium]|nr:glycosyltransferase [Lachnospiraceae bacterium]
LGQSYDIETLIRAARKLEDETSDTKTGDRKNIRFKLLGTGPNMESLQALTEELGASNVEFLGYTAYPKMAAYLNQSDIVVNSFIKGAPQSIPNKIGDYLASGSAIISTLENPVAKALLDNNDCGQNVEPGNVDALFDVIKCLIDDEDRRDRQGRNARALAESRFDRAVSYQEIVRMADRLAK